MADVSSQNDWVSILDEIMAHRNYLLLALMSADPELEGWISRQHADGTMFPGHFIAGCYLVGEPITYHLPLELWDLALAAEVRVLDRAPEWDEYTPNDVLARLGTFIRLTYLSEI